MVKIVHPSVTQIRLTDITTQPREEVFTSNNLGETTTHTTPTATCGSSSAIPTTTPRAERRPGGHVPTDLGGRQYGRIKEIHVDADPANVLSLIGGDGDLTDFVSPARSRRACIVRPSTKGSISTW